MQKLETRNRIKGGIERYLTTHAVERMARRGLSSEAVQTVLEFGRVAYVRGTAIYAFGRKEAERFAKQGVDLGCYEGIQVVCTLDRTILTVYKNRNFRGLRPYRRRPSRKLKKSLKWALMQDLSRKSLNFQVFHDSLEQFKIVFPQPVWSAT